MSNSTLYWLLMLFIVTFTTVTNVHIDGVTAKIIQTIKETHGKS